MKYIFRNFDKITKWRKRSWKEQSYRQCTDLNESEGMPAGHDEKNRLQWRI